MAIPCGLPWGWYFNILWAPDQRATPILSLDILVSVEVTPWGIHNSRFCLKNEARGKKNLKYILTFSDSEIDVDCILHLDGSYGFPVVYTSNSKEGNCWDLSLINHVHWCKAGSDDVQHEDKRMEQIKDTLVVYFSWRYFTLWQL